MLTACSIPTNPSLDNLLVFVFNRYRPKNQELVLQIAQGQTLASLAHFYLNLGELQSTHHELTPVQVGMFRDLYDQLSALSVDKRLKPGLSFYVHCIRLNFKIEFQYYQFNLRQGLLHFGETTKGLCKLPSYSVSTVKNFLDIHPLFPSRNFARFHELYPNIQIVKLNSLSDNKRPDTFVQEFEAFLASCNGLMDLQLMDARFAGGFYQNLAQMKSCRTLRQLLVLEKNTFGELIDFDTLYRLAGLCRFETNVLRRDIMMTLLKQNRMWLGQEFSFRFHFQNTKSSSIVWRQIQIRKVDEDRYCLTAETWTDQRNQADFRIAVSFRELLNRLERELKTDYLKHFLDDLKEKPLDLMSI